MLRPKRMIVSHRVTFVSFALMCMFVAFICVVVWLMQMVVAQPY